MYDLEQAGFRGIRFSDFAWMVAKVPCIDTLRQIIMRTAQVVDVPLAAALEELLAVHDGQVLRIDGNFKLPRHVKLFVAGRRRARYVPVGKAILNCTGTTGFMNRRNALVSGERGDTISAMIAAVAAHRIAWAQAMATAGTPVPNNGLFAAILVDADKTYGNRLRRELASLWPEQAVPLAEAGEGVSKDCAVLIGEEWRTIPLSKCIIAGDAKHISLNVQNQVLCSAVDARTFKQDINDAIMRWSWARASEVQISLRPPTDHIWGVVDLNDDAKALLLRIVAGIPGSNRGIAELKSFLEEPWCQYSPVWGRVLDDRGSPPRRALERIASQAGATLHETCGALGWDDASDYRQEVARCRRWYEQPVAARVRQLAREDAPDALPSARVSVLRNEVLAKMDRVISDDVVKSLTLWSSVAAAIRRTGLKVYSGTVPTEALWAHLRNALGKPTRTTIKEDMWDVMQALVFINFVYQRSARTSFPKAANHDSLAAQALLALQHDFFHGADGKRRVVDAWWKQ